MYFRDLSLPLWILAIYRLPLWILAIYHCLVDLSDLWLPCGFQRFIAALWISAIYRCPVDLSNLSLPVDLSDLLLPVDFLAAIASFCLSVQRGEQHSVLSVKLRVQRGEKRSVPWAHTCKGLFCILIKKKKHNHDGGRPRCGKPCAEDSLRKAIRQERPKILY